MNQWLLLILHHNYENTRETQEVATLPNEVSTSKLRNDEL